MNRQNDFIFNTVKIVPKGKVSYHSSQSKRKSSRKYFFKVNDESIQVCSKFYFDTLDITFRKTEWALQKGSKYTSGLTGTDQRGKHFNRPNKVPTSSKNAIIEHINSFPRIDSHNCRKNSKKEYLSEDLSIAKCTIYMSKIV